MCVVKFFWSMSVIETSYASVMFLYVSKCYIDRCNNSRGCVGVGVGVGVGVHNLYSSISS